MVAVHVSAAGAPLAVLSNRTAHTFHRGMRCWMCLADTAFPASAFHSILAPSSGAPALWLCVAETSIQTTADFVRFRDLQLHRVAP